MTDTEQMNDLSRLGLSAEQKAARLDRIGASDLNIICGGDDAAVLRLWEEKTRAREPEDLSNVLPVIMGQFTEPLNRMWFEKMTGLRVWEPGCERVGPSSFPLVATLDGMVARDNSIEAVFEAKHVHSNTADETVTQRYMPQLHGQMYCLGVKRAHLSVFFGNMKWEWFEVDYDEEYGRHVLEAAELFWGHVIAQTPPVTIAPPALPVAPDKLRAVDFTGNNEWADLAATWLENKEPAAKFDKASKQIKDLIEPDIGEASGHGIVVKRAKNNSLRIGVEK